ncbi:MAG: adenosylcobinamide-GDP ribazoletransferase [Nocardioides sp.]|nr:adenosylcobinamide-GDP ribazoletransferase [Nocardioides sp.]MCW2833721.1 adenosylcobinamide-GDP ribazoletransferase [Nocardioides sp.]
MGVRAARPDGLGHTYTQTVARWAVGLVWVLVAVALAVASASAGLPWWQGALAAAAALATIAGLLVRVARRFGGVTGDVFGAGIELAFAVILVVLSIGR